MMPLPEGTVTITNGDEAETITTIMMVGEEYSMMRMDGQ
jgi:hypothetical protein